MKEMNQKMIVRCGKAIDSLDVLKSLCEKEADNLLKIIEVSSESGFSVSFFTDECKSELICVGNFNRAENGQSCYTLDFSETTL